MLELAFVKDLFTNISIKLSETILNYIKLY